MAPHKNLNFIPKRFSRSTCDFDSGGSIEKIRQAQCECFFFTYLHLVISSSDWKKEAGVGELISD